MISQSWLTHGQYRTKKKVGNLWEVENTNILDQVSAQLDWIPQAVPWLSVKIAMGWLYIWYFCLLYIICMEIFSFGQRTSCCHPVEVVEYKMDLTLRYHKILPSWIFQVIATHCFRPKLGSPEPLWASLPAGSGLASSLFLNVMQGLQREHNMRIWLICHHYYQELHQLIKKYFKNGRGAFHKGRL